MKNEQELFSLVQHIRGFNRLYINQLGLLDKKVAGTGFSMAEARTLYEIGIDEGLSQGQLKDRLRMDPGYLSRTIKKFEKAGLVTKSANAQDGRVSHLKLTPKGMADFQTVNQNTDKMIASLLAGLSPAELVALQQNFQSLKGLLNLKNTGQTGPEVTIREDIQPGDLGYLVYLHGKIYAAEFGYNHKFEGFVAKTFHEFSEGYSKEKDRLWLAEMEGKIVGSIAIVGRGEGHAQLRWFMLEDKCRGKGVGKRLFQHAMDFCKLKRYGQVYLHTTSEQVVASSIYQKAGFKLVSEEKDSPWGKEILIRKFVLEL